MYGSSSGPNVSGQRAVSHCKVFISCCPGCHLASISFLSMTKLISLGTEGIIDKCGVSRQDDISGDLPIVADHGNN